MVSRYGTRVSVECAGVYAGEMLVDEGRIRNVSLSGCQLEGAHQTMKRGDSVHLRVFMPDHQIPLNVPLAMVRWVGTNRAGLEFIRSSQEDQTRLTRFVRQQKQLAGVWCRWNEPATKLQAPRD
jgi:PilZ domain-containing protein